VAAHTGVGPPMSARRRRLASGAVRAAAELPPPSPEELARYWEHCTNILATQAIEVQAAWLSLLELLEARGLLVIGEIPDARIGRMEHAVRALSKGPVQ